LTDSLLFRLLPAQPGPIHEGLAINGELNFLI